MSAIAKINIRNDVHLPKEIINKINLNKTRLVKVDAINGVIYLIPIDVEERYSNEALEGLDQLFIDEKKKGFIKLQSKKDIAKLLK